MTAQAAQEAARGRWPTAHGAAEAEAFVLQAENLARAEVLGQPPLTALPAGALAIPAPYDAAYVHFAAAMLAQLDGVYDRYNAELALYSALYDAWARAYRRQNLPARGAEVRAYG